ncbi:SDR family oxidoreductase [Saccharopolyspora sp. K220]|uniref:SDR family NAD(P)-dependent oxidoreductase n=1 Tax=Saccharopolyspora soli TaxID=2926618 RepID=UPI001F55D628|nr:SDR family oxidoreductase [Saccharopolyspora soli]MCI2416940.1 SDR family oxidoreductase [Saccharopolyspora soli]
MDNRTTALITGASSGIGQAYAQRLAARGHDLVLVARRADRLAELAADLRSVHVKALPVDLAVGDGIAAVEAEIAGNPDLAVVVNAAGIGALGPLVDADVADVEQLVTLNVLALTRLSRAALSAFRARGGGQLVNIGSLGAFRAPPGGAAYGASKAYVLHLSRALQRETADTGTQVQVVLPGPVRTEFFDAAGSDATLFPDESFITAEELVDAALSGLDRGELVCIPTLQDVAAWERVAALQDELRDLAGLRGIIAPRYTPANRTK